MVLKSSKGVLKKQEKGWGFFLLGLIYGVSYQECWTNHGWFCFPGPKIWNFPSDECWINLQFFLVFYNFNRLPSFLLLYWVEQTISYLWFWYFIFFFYHSPYRFVFTHKDTGCVEPIIPRYWPAASLTTSGCRFFPHW